MSQTDSKKQQPPVPVPDERQLFQAHTVLGTGGQSDLGHVLQCYQLKDWVMAENDERDHDKEQRYLDAKFTLTHQALFNQIIHNPDHRFSTKGCIPFDNPCPKCSGLGQQFKFMRKTMIVTCMKCKGSGQNEDGSKCPTCRTGKAKTKTPGKIQTFGIIPQFREVTVCTKCRGRGFLQQKNQTNPVVDESTGAKLKRQLVEKEVPVEEPKNIGTAIQSAPPENAADEEMIEVPSDEGDEVPETYKLDPETDVPLQEPGTSMKEKLPPAE